MTLAEFLEVCKCYKDLGWAIEEQVDSVVAGDMTEDSINLNALKDIMQWLHEVEELARGPNGNDKLLRDVEETLQRCEDYTAET